MAIPWEQFKRPDGSIDLFLAFHHALLGRKYGPLRPQPSRAGIVAAGEFLKGVEELQPIQSRQVAALAIATALDRMVT